MKFDTPAGINPIDRLKVIGQPVERYEAKLKVTGTATYAYEHHGAEAAAYGYILGAGIAKGRIRSIDLREAMAAPGVRVIVTHENAGKLGVGQFYVQRVLGGPEIDHYHQAVAVVVADTFEQARAATALIRIDYDREQGLFDLVAQLATAPVAKPGPFGGPTSTNIGDFARAMADAPVTVDQTYTVPDQAHAMMEPHATIASWQGDQLTCWTAIQQVSWGTRDLGLILGIPRANIRLISPCGRRIGGKGTVQSDLALAALAAKAAGCKVKLALPRALMFNNTVHRPKTIQRVRLGQRAMGV
jgi:xanthine dehydrogenase YagR molybdenum-binding subunit